MASVRVAVIDPLSDTRELVVEVLQAAGHDVEVFGSVRDAFAGPADSRPRIAFLGSLRHLSDMRTRMDRESSPGHVLVVLATAAQQATVPQLSGVTVLPKPFGIEQLLGSVADMAEATGVAPGRCRRDLLWR